MDIRNVLAQNIRRYRKQKGWTQEDLAEALGTDRTYVSSMERGLRNPSIQVVSKIAEVLGVESFMLLK
jgi:transcriptional regulator with XRE-family HTH domain